MLRLASDFCLPVARVRRLGLVLLVLVVLVVLVLLALALVIELSPSLGASAVGVEWTGVCVALVVWAVLVCVGVE